VIKRDAKMAHLSQVGLFSDCTRGQLRELAKHTTEVRAPAGAVLCREGERGRECFVIRDGEASVTIAGDAIATVGPGAIFGELSLLDGQPRIATVTAASDMELVVLSRREFDEMLATVPAVSRRILQSVGARLRVADVRLHAGHAA
jgi:CRP-like cAMP-binding protein